MSHKLLDKLWENQKGFISRGQHGYCPYKASAFQTRSLTKKKQNVGIWPVSSAAEVYAERIQNPYLFSLLQNGIKFKE